MRKSPSLIAIGSLTILAIQAMSCGSNNNSNRFLQSITVTPAAADAQKFPNGQVQFTATGNFTKPPSPSVLTFATPYSGGFNVDPAMATIVSTGTGTVTVQCLPGASGTTTVTALACKNATGTKATCAVANGTAQLTCP